MIRSVLICSGLAAALAGCKEHGRVPDAERLLIESEARERELARALPMIPRGAPGDEIVATVDGVPIYASEAATQARQRGVTVRAAVDELIGRELLASEARRRGLDLEHDVRESRNSPLVRALLKRDFEPTFDGPEDIPAGELAHAYQQNLGKFVHDSYRSVVYVRAGVVAAEPPEKQAAAQALARQLRAKFPAGAGARIDCAALKQAAQELIAAGESTITFSDYEGFRDGTDPTFGDVMYTLPEPGALSEPLKTQWGWDVICLAKITPGQNRSLADAEPELRERFFEPARAAAFRRFVDQIVGSHDVRLPLEPEDSVVRAFGDDRVAPRAGAEPSQGGQGS